jgi:hypothetical protein
MAPRWLNPCVLGPYLLDVANDVLNGMEVVAPYHLNTSRACMAWRRVVELLGTVAVHHK